MKKMDEEIKSLALSSGYSEEEAQRMLDDLKNGTDSGHYHGGEIQHVPLVPHGQKVLLEHDCLQEMFDDLEEVLEHLLSHTPDMSLSLTERLSMRGSGVRRYGFIEKVSDIAPSRPDLAPGFFDLEYLKDLTEQIAVLRNIRGMVQQIDRVANDALLVTGDEAFRVALMYYNSVRDAARRRVPGAEAIFRILELFFRRGRRIDREPTVPETESDVDALLHRRKEGRIVIENEADRVIAGKHTVIDQTHTAKGNFKETEEGEIEA
ncbi:MAG: hypothetical protein LBI04_09310 [Treponema sp.]|nr:hypothetical protein [Treponema sp.]